MSTKSLCISFSALRYLDSGLGLDCVLVADNERMRCHRIILAKLSEWFYSYFKNQNTGCIDEIKIPYNPLGLFISFIQMIYGNKIEITEVNAVPFLSISKYYGFKEFDRIIRPKIDKILDELSPLNIITNMISYDLSNEAAMYIPRLIPSLSKMSGSSRKSFMEKVDINFFVVLMSTLTRSIDKEQQMESINIFWETHTNLSEDDRRSLHKLIDWEDPFFQAYAKRHICEWLPNDQARAFISQVIDHRRCVLNTLDQFDNCNEIISRWYPFSIIDKLLENEHNEKGLLGQLFNENSFSSSINVHDYGIILMSATPEYHISRGLRSLFIRDGYYMGKSEKVDELYISFDFGRDSIIKAESLLINSQVLRGREQIEQFYFTSYNIMIEHSITNIRSEKVFAVDSPVCRIDIHGFPPFHKITIRPISSSPYRNYFRLKNIDIFGEILLKDIQHE